MFPKSRGCGSARGILWPCNRQPPVCDCFEVLRVTCLASTPPRLRHIWADSADFSWPSSTASTVCYSGRSPCQFCPALSLQISSSESELPFVNSFLSLCHQAISGILLIFVLSCLSCLPSFLQHSNTMLKCPHSGKPIPDELITARAAQHSAWYQAPQSYPLSSSKSMR